MPYVAESRGMIVFGASGTSRHYLDRNRDAEKQVFLVDNDSSLWGSDFAGLVVQAPAELASIEFSEVVVPFAHVVDVLNQLIAMGVPSSAVIVPAKHRTMDAQFASHEQRQDAWELLCFVLAVLAELGVESIIEQGVALGFFRDGDFIAGDCDIDISVPSASFFQTGLALAALATFQSSPLVVAAEIIGNGLVKAIDITSQSGVPLSIFGRRTELGVSRHHLPKHDVPADILYPPSSIEIRGRGVPLPGDCESYLLHVYGPSWRLPNPDWTFADYANIQALLPPRERPAP